MEVGGYCRCRLLEVGVIGGWGLSEAGSVLEVGLIRSKELLVVRGLLKVGDY